MSTFKKEGAIGSTTSRRTWIRWIGFISRSASMTIIVGKKDHHRVHSTEIVIKGRAS
jgi:hypothetical protein